MKRRFMAVTCADRKNGGLGDLRKQEIRISWSKVDTPEGAITDTLGLRGRIAHGIFVKDVGTTVSTLRNDKKRIELLTTKEGYKTLCQWYEKPLCMSCAAAVYGDDGYEKTPDGHFIQRVND